MDDFSNHPKTISEIRAEQSGDGSKWTVRDVLIAALRDIDSGEKTPENICIFMGWIDDDNKTHTSFYQSSRNTFELLGMIEETKVNIQCYK